MTAHDQTTLIVLIGWALNSDLKITKSHCTH